MSKRKWSDEDLIVAVKQSKSYSEVIKKLGLVVAGSNFDTIKRKIKELSLDTSHMTGQGWNVGERYSNPKSQISLSDILTEHSTYISSFKLKNRLFAEGLKDKCCEQCGNSYWLGEPIALELHHINGQRDDNRLENLKILCPNCHAMTDNYRGKNKGNYILS